MDGKPLNLDYPLTSDQLLVDHGTAMLHEIINELCGSSSINRLEIDEPRKFGHFLQNIENQEKEMIASFNEFDSNEHAKFGNSMCSGKNPSTEFLYLGELLKALEKAGLKYEDYLNTMDDLKNNNEPEEDNQENMELDEYILEATSDPSNKSYNKDILGVHQNTFPVKPSIVSGNGNIVVDNQSKVEIVHQRLSKEIMKYEKANESQVNDSISPDMLPDFDSEEAYVNFIIYSRSLLNIEQINLTTRYFHDEYKIRPQSAVERHSNSGKLCDRTKLLERNLGYYFGLPDETGTSHWGDGCECGSCLQEKTETVVANTENYSRCKVEEVGKPSVVEVSVDAAKFTVPTKPTEDDKASRPGTSSSLTLQLAYGNDASCHSSSLALSDLKELGTQSMTSQCPVAAIGPSTFQNVCDEVDSRSVVEVSSVTGNHNVLTEQTGEKAVSSLDPLAATTTALFDVNDSTNELTSMTSCAARKSHENPDNDVSSIPEILSGSENCDSNFSRLNNSSQIKQSEKSTQTTNLIEYIHKQIINLNSHNTNVETEPSVFMRELSCQFLTINECDLKSNDLKGITQLNNLEFLDASRNHLNGVNLGEMNLSKLTILNLAYNKMTKLSDIMGCFPNLLMLDISSNYITTLDIQKLVISFPKLYQLMASSNLITCIQIKSSTTKWTNENLNLLDLSDNEITVIDQDSIPLTNITRLQLSSNILNKPFQTGFYGVILQELILDHNNLTSINWLGDSWLPNLIYLNVSHNRITDLPILPFPLLQKLIISHNLINEIESLFKGTKFLPRNCMLDIRCNPCTLGLNFMETIKEEFPNTITTSNQDSESTMTIFQNHEFQTTVFSGSICQCSQCIRLRISCEQYHKEYQKCANCLNLAFKRINDAVTNNELLCLNKPISNGHVTCHLNSNDNLHLENQPVQFNNQNILLNIFSKENQCSLMYHYIGLIKEITILKRKQTELLKLFFNEMNNKVLMNDTKNGFQHIFPTKEIIQHLELYKNSSN
ncbi:putative leucine-rich repeat-containing protein [Schistosoma mansoni]|uniref:putative leucine-rich repeat-containing protein n=1 Tax=Schistosoma mansoni TaxID=6183 RepID=UPI0001A62FE9|nr:putative leucine-rich repeat-containing protein [Schistosoma mansoni]|eukprot:XP_018647969.1 putative leucine-rich repeat-containing protein [Schistosoma mansoni]